MARLPRRWQGVAMMLVIVPFWTSFLIRIYAWVNILQHDGPLNNTLLALHLGVVFALFITMPYGKFVHGIYRFVALVRYARERQMIAGSSLRDASE